MNTTEIEKLLDKYYEGETTLHDEEILKEFFRQNDIPAELQPHKALFIWTDAELNEPVPDFEIILPEEKTDDTPVISLNSRKPVLRWISGIAAGIAITAGLWFALSQYKQEIIKEQKAQVAYEQTKEALMLLSVNLNTGLDQARKFQSFGETMEKVTSFSAFYKYQTININQNDSRSQNNLQ